MLTSLPAAGRLVRPAVAAFLGLLLLLLAGAPALAAGTGGVDVSPYPGRTAKGDTITAFHATVPSKGDVTVRYALRNTTQATATATLYATTATQQGGQFAVGSDPSPYLDFPKRTVTLQPGALQLQSFRAHADGGKRPAKNSYAAVVVEVKRGSVVTRAATIVYLQPGRRVPLPVLIVSIAVLAIALVGLGLGAVLLLRRRRAAPA